MFRFFIVIIILGFCGSTQAQHTISGIVVDASTGKRIPKANVFITNTSSGTVCTDSGTFILTNVPVGTYEVVISSIGYNTQTYTYKAAELPLRLKIVMPVKVTTQEVATVRAFLKDGWEKWGKLFLENYLGTTTNSDNCVIKNKEVIKFRMDKQRNTLEVVATDLIRIENKSLGYIINHQLELFEIDFTSNIVTNTGYPYFTPIIPKRKRKSELYTTKRGKAYNGSLQHFFKSIYTDSIADNGFIVNDYIQEPNTEKQRIKSLIANYYKEQRALGNDKIVVAKGGLIPNLHPDTAAYYSTRLQQKDYFVRLGKVLTAKDLIIQIDSVSNEKKITFPNWLYVQYTKEPQEERYYFGKLGVQKTPHQTTLILFREGIPKELTINSNGNFYNVYAILLNGYMGWEKMGDMLPIDYGQDE